MSGFGTGFLRLPRESAATGLLDAFVRLISPTPGLGNGLVKRESFVRSQDDHLYADLGFLSGEFVPAEESDSGYAYWRIPVDEVRSRAEERKSGGESAESVETRPADAAPAEEEDIERMRVESKGPDVGDDRR